MSFAPSFGSLGDFVTVCQLAIQLGKALGDGFGGSSTEYQELRTGVDTLVQVLTHVEESRKQLESHPELHGLCRMIRNVTDQCGYLIKDALDRIVPKYSDSLRAGGSTTRSVGARRKIEWAVSERQRLPLLKDKIRTASATLTVLIGLATQKVLRIEHASMAKKVDKVLETQGQVEKTVTTQFTKLEGLSQQQSQQLLALDEKVNTANSKSSSAVDLTNSLLRRLVEDVQHVKYQMSNPLPPNALDPTKELPILLEDALGYQLVVPMDWVDSWEGFYQLLRLRFQKIGKGQDLVKRGQFALEEASSGRDIDRRVPISISFRRGMKIDMSIMFSNEESIEGACPRCREPANAPDNTTVSW
ncbi:hypothetical protein B0T14DRAFT_1158 [Immersiella caudata]|uniref:Ubiquitin-like domain-containing protein n=1 Tax=Immersiella caudata TaxID=314043 RepID=A0AA39XCS3_9PEZI|nr:hypothetical protein B0T14DRAFT_1158 [Immersiella caudata]